MRQGSYSGITQSNVGEKYILEQQKYNMVSLYHKVQSQTRAKGAY